MRNHSGPSFEVLWASSWTIPAILVGCALVVLLELPSEDRWGDWRVVLLLLGGLGPLVGLIQARLIPPAVASSWSWFLMTAVGIPFGFLFGIIVAETIAAAINAIIGGGDSSLLLIEPVVWIAVSSIATGGVAGLMIAIAQSKSAQDQRALEEARWIWTNTGAGALFVVLLALVYALPVIPPAALLLVGVVLGASAFGIITGLALKRALKATEVRARYR